MPRRAIRHTLPALSLVAAIAAGAGCATASAGSRGPWWPAPPPEPGRPLTLWVVDLDGRRGYAVYARNDSDRVHRVTGVTLRDCTNIGIACDTHRVDHVLCPGDLAAVFDVPVTAPQRPSFFNWRYHARGYEPGEPVIGAQCEQGGL